MSEIMKKVIADSIERLLFEKKAKRLTVSGIIREGYFARQTFYHYFKNIPDLLRWIFQMKSDKLARDIQARDTDEEKLRCCTLSVIDIINFLERGMQTNYASEIEKLANVFLSEVNQYICEKEIAKCEECH